MDKRAAGKLITAMDPDAAGLLLSKLDDSQTAELLGEAHPQPPSLSGPGPEVVSVYHFPRQHIYPTWSHLLICTARYGWVPLYTKRMSLCLIYLMSV